MGYCNERKTLRLAFHDCSPYKNGGGGCDGSLSLDENLPDNDGLQFTVAVLVSIGRKANVIYCNFSNFGKLQSQTILYPNHKS